MYSRRIFFRKTAEVVVGAAVVVAGQKEICAPKPVEKPVVKNQERRVVHNYHTGIAGCNRIGDHTHSMSFTQSDHSHTLTVCHETPTG